MQPENEAEAGQEDAYEPFAGGCTRTIGELRLPRAQPSKHLSLCRFALRQGKFNGLSKAHSSFTLCMLQLVRMLRIAGECNISTRIAV